MVAWTRQYPSLGGLATQQDEVIFAGLRGSREDETYLIAGHSEVSTNDADIFISALDSSSGKDLWTKRLGSSDGGMDVLRDFRVFHDYYIIGGGTRGALYGAPKGGSDAFVAMLSAENRADPIWGYQNGSSDEDEVTAVAGCEIEGKLHVFGCGSSRGNFPVEQTQGGETPFCLKFNRQGELEWKVGLDLAGDGGVAFAVAADPLSCEVIVGGVLNGAGRGSQTWWVARLAASDGRMVWLQKGNVVLRSLSTSAVTSIALRGHGDIVAAGFTTDDLFANAGEMWKPSRGSTDGFVVWISRNGVFNGGINVDIEGNDYINDIVIAEGDSGENSEGSFSAFICGSTGKPPSAFIGRLSSNRVDSLHTFGSDGADSAQSISIALDGSIYASGWTSSALFSRKRHGKLLEAWAFRLPFPPPSDVLPIPPQSKSGGLSHNLFISPSFIVIILLCLVCWLTSAKKIPRRIRKMVHDKSYRHEELELIR